MKVLHVAPQNFTGVLNLFVRGHRALGHESRLVTFFPAANRYPEDICLDLPFVGPMEWLWKLKRLLRVGSMKVPFTGTTRRIFWKPSTLERPLRALRSRVWKPRIDRAAREYGLWDFDVFQLEGGMSFYRDGRDVRMLRKRGKGIVSHYHGLDLRMRGAIRPVWEATDLHLTCEFDLYRRYGELRYLFLPYNPEEVPAAKPEGEVIRVCHAPRIRSVKGTDRIIEVVDELSGQVPVELVLIENMPHSEAMALKATCHLAIDQIADGDMGYGVNSLETLSMGIPTVTNLSEAYREFIPDHPFVLADRGTLGRVLRELVLDPDLRALHAKAGPSWIRRRHHWLSVARRLHELYREAGLGS